MDIPYHRDKDCLLVWHRVACKECGYPPCEARFDNVEEWAHHEMEQQLAFMEIK